MSTAVDWDALAAAAVDAAQRAYAPYSKLHVGAAALTDTGEIVVGCNVENVSFGLTLCAECVLVGNQRLARSSRSVAFIRFPRCSGAARPAGRARATRYSRRRAAARA